MPDRADYLAKLLLERRDSLEASLLDDAAPDEDEVARARRELVEKILTVEAGITDATTVQLVLNAFPQWIPDEEVHANDRLNFSEFLRRTLKLN